MGIFNYFGMDLKWEKNKRENDEEDPKMKQET